MTHHGGIFTGKRIIGGAPGSSLHSVVFENALQEVGAEPLSANWTQPPLSKDETGHNRRSILPSLGWLGEAASVRAWQDVVPVRADRLEMPWLTPTWVPGDWPVPIGYGISRVEQDPTS